MANGQWHVQVGATSHGWQWRVLCGATLQPVMTGNEPGAIAASRRAHQWVAWLADVQAVPATPWDCVDASTVADDVAAFMRA